MANKRWQQATNPEVQKLYDRRSCEIASVVYRPTGVERRLRYILLRAKKPEDPNCLFPEGDGYDYLIFCTNYSEQLLSDEDVVLTYRKRGQAENYIRENKYGFDLKNFPCLKLNANRAYGIIAATAYNLFRCMALLHDRDHNHTYLSKNIRYKWIHIPCSVARSARDSVFRYMRHHATEMSLWLKRITDLQFEFG